MNIFRFIILFLALIIIIAIAYFIPVNEHTTIYIGLISALTGLMTVVLALMVYNKFGVERHLVEKRFLLVTELLTEIAKKRYTLRLLTKKRVDTYIIFFHPRYSKSFLQENDVKKSMVIGRSYVNGLTKIEELSKNFLMPESIAKKLEPLIIDYIDQTEGVTVTDYYEKDYYHIEDDLHSLDLEKDDMVGKINGKEITVEQFVHDWQEVIEETVAWINSNSSIKTNITLK